MQVTQLTGGRGWLESAAAASVHRIDRQLGRLADVNDAGRSAEQANKNRAAWEDYKYRGGPWAPYALGADESVHCKGRAVDSDDWYNDAAAAVWRENGWRQTARYNDDRDEPWHGEYLPENDQHINDPEPAPATTNGDNMITIARWIKTGACYKVGPESIWYIGSQEELGAQQVLYGEMKNLDDVGFRAVIDSNFIPWAVVEQVTRGQVYGTNGRYWSRSAAEGEAGRAGTKRVQSSLDQVAKNLADVKVTLS
ncbi:hypothetical protein [Microbacterium sp. GXS0129]|uniref:hypothetical protein n=1 Tax=Microbacterium sp. GXS0129 TaxID=3377836 RepID=UPI00383B6E8B